MNQRALVSALLLAIVGVTLLLLHVRKFEREMSGGEHVELLMAIKPIARGVVITDDMLSTRSVPIAYVEDRAIKAGERSKVLGIQAATTLSAQQTLMWTDLAILTEDRDLSSLVQPGKRGVTVRASTGDDTRGNALIRPGDYVDVIATMLTEGDLSKDKASVVLLQRILVLAVGFDTDLVATADPKGRPSAQSDKLLTLSLNLQEAQLLALAIEKGRLSVAVRNPDDQSVVTDIPDMNASALLDTRSRVEAQRARRLPPSNQPVRIESSAP
jgi:pilus assembly protein CpaB